MVDDSDLLFPPPDYETEDINSYAIDESKLEEVYKERDYSGLNFDERNVDDEKFMIYCVEMLFEEQILKPLEGGQPSMSGFTNELISYLEQKDRKGKTVAEKIQKGREEDARRKGLEARVIKLTRALHKFIAAMCKKYLEVRPRPHDDRFPYSTGRYQRSSLMYFTKDAQSRTNALAEAKSHAFDAKFPFYGMKYVLRYTRFSEIFRDDGDVDARIEKIKGGITIENVAFAGDSKTKHYYGWYNVEKEGWWNKNTKVDENGNVTGKRDPYQPFQLAVAYAMASVPGIVEVNFVD